MQLKAWLSAETGRSTRLARHMGVSPAAITHWASGTVPLHAIREVVAFTGGEVTFAEMVEAALDRAVAARAEQP